VLSVLNRQKTGNHPQDHRPLAFEGAG